VAAASVVTRVPRKEIRMRRSVLDEATAQAGYTTRTRETRR
jgi:hypothetical protein